MIKNHLKVALRAFRRQKGYAVINMVGLAVGLASSFFILLWVNHAVQFDQFHENGDRLYRVMRHVGPDTWISMPKPLVDVLEADYPEVEHALLLSWERSPLLSVGEKTLREDARFAGPAFFEMFSFPLLEGDAATVLDDPASVAISASAAGRLFGADWAAQDVIGETIRVEERRDFTVTGVFQDIPEQSSIQADVVLSAADFIEQNSGWIESWSSSGSQLYVQLKDGTSHEAVNAKIASVINDREPQADATVFLKPYEEIYLYGEYDNGKLAGGRIEFVRLFIVVAVFLLLIAAINFMNLATARSGQRAMEIGVRKAIGAGQATVAWQFLMEAVLLALGAFVLAVGLVVVLLSPFAELTGIGFSLETLDPRFLMAGVGIALAVGLLAGSYPALYLSSFRPVVALRGTFRQGRGTMRLRRGLVVFQFALSTLLIVGTLTVYLQMRYIQTKDLGVDRENVIMMTLEGPARAQYGSFQQELLQQPGIDEMALSNQNPMQIGNSTRDLVWDDKPDNFAVDFYVMEVSTGLVETLRMDMAAGRAFSPDLATDSNHVVINQRTAEIMGMPDPVGESISLWGREGVVIGVVEDFHMGSLHVPIEPTVMRLDDEPGLLFVRTDPGQTAKAIASLEKLHSQYNPGYPFDYRFLDASYEETYQAEAVMGALMRLFAVVALFVAGLGLFGLMSFTAEQRRKEVGVRKVLGASVADLVALLTKDYIALVLVAFVISVPLAYLAGMRWLEGFEYRVGLGPGPFLLAGGLLIGFALVTVSSQALRAATADPVHALRSD